MIASGNASPPVEFAILDYNSQDGLNGYIETARELCANGVFITYAQYMKREYYHMAHARNLSVLASHGEYIIVSSADILFDEEFIGYIRSRLVAEDLIWMHGGGKFFNGVMAVKRQEFIDAGGFDERFEYYGPEDKDLNDRLARRGGKCGVYPWRMLDLIPTPNDVKVKNYDLSRFAGKHVIKREMNRLMKEIYRENNANRVLVANQGKGWGSWD